MFMVDGYTESCSTIPGHCASIKSRPCSYQSAYLHVCYCFSTYSMLAILLSIWAKGMAQWSSDWLTWGSVSSLDSSEEVNILT